MIQTITTENKPIDLKLVSSYTPVVLAFVQGVLPILVLSFLSSLHSVVFVVCAAILVHYYLAVHRNLIFLIDASSLGVEVLSGLLLTAVCDFTSNDYSVDLVISVWGVFAVVVRFLMAFPNTQKSIAVHSISGVGCAAPFILVIQLLSPVQTWKLDGTLATLKALLFTSVSCVDIYLGCVCVDLRQLHPFSRHRATLFLQGAILFCSHLNGVLMLTASFLLAQALVFSCLRPRLLTQSKKKDDDIESPDLNYPLLPCTPRSILSQSSIADTPPSSCHMFIQQSNLPGTQKGTADGSQVSKQFTFGKLPLPKTAFQSTKTSNVELSQMFGGGRSSILSSSASSSPRQVATSSDASPEENIVKSDSCADDFERALAQTRALSHDMPENAGAP